MPPRKDRICGDCNNCVPATDKLEPECNVDEDMESGEYCDSFERKDGKA